MEQIILSNIRLPEVSRDQYSCWEEELSVQVDMISGRRVIERRGKVWKASYSYDYMGSQPQRDVLAVLRSGAPVLCSVLTPASDELYTAYFVVESVSGPTMAFSRKDRAFWHRISFTLREERPH